MRHHGQSLKTYMFLVVFLSMSITAVAMGLITFNLVNTNTEQVISQASSTNAKLVETIYKIRQQELFDIGFNLVQDDTMQKHIETKSLENISKSLKALQDNYGIDIILIIDKENTILASTNKNLKNKTNYLDTITSYIQQHNVPVVSTDVLSKEFLVDEFKNIKIRKIPSAYEDTFELSQTYEEDALAIIAAIPIVKEDTTLGTLFIADILNKDHELPNLVKSITGQQATIYLNDVSVSTSRLTSSGEPFIGVMLPENIKNNIMQNDSILSQRNWFLDGWQRETYFPLHNHNNNIVGTIKVSVKENDFVKQSFLFKSLKISQIILILILIIILVSLFMSYIIARKFIRPIHNLIDSIDKAAKGNYNQGMDIRSFSEMNILAKHYNVFIRQFRYKKK